jgi:hypothetical protein
VVNVNLAILAEISIHEMHKDKMARMAVRPDIPTSSQSPLIAESYVVNPRSVMDFGKRKNLDL